jgi:hypothetical protein
VILLWSSKFVNLLIFTEMKVMKSKTASGRVYVPSRAARVASAKSNEQRHAPTKSTPGPEAFAPSSDSAPGSSDVPEGDIDAYD